ncbi:MAG TPA: tripartite tricarboxylate transporter substrate binding protein [Xanthobacteraceae bacterium]|jgi:tripartite-type tricarboxylate transporter receptor subunit TctC|nr:tripartite tricarboxylate transporter substrate binding protein [Xanthobacteraceae bacterium]
MMKYSRRKFLHFAAGAAALPFAPRIACAQTFPSRPVRIIVAVPAGGPIDLAARLIGQWLSERLGQPFVVENRVGAGNNIGTEAAARAPADGYTLLVTAAAAAINATLFDKLNYNFMRDFAPIASINHIPLLLSVHPSFSVATVSELIAYAKANPGKVNMATPGLATAPDLASELLKMMAGIDIVVVRYRGSPAAMTDLIGGQVQTSFDAVPTSIEHARSGRLRALAVAMPARLEVLPDIPTVAETVPGFAASGWCGLCAPKATPTEIVDRLNREVNAALIDPRIKARLADIGAISFATSPGEFAKFIAEETEKWGKVIRFAGIKAE